MSISTEESFVTVVSEQAAECFPSAEPDIEEDKTPCHPVTLAKRFYVALMLCSGLALCTIYRLILSLAILEIVFDGSRSLNKSRECIHSHLSSIPLLIELKGAKHGWDCEMPGVVKASFFPGYILSHIPGGYAADAFGGRLIYGQGVLVTGVLTLLSPLCISVSPYLFMFNRFLQGLSQGPMNAALNSLLAQWSPPLERTTLSVLANSGSVVGQVLGNILLGLTLSWLKWHSSFYIFGVLSIPWAIIWFRSVSNSPHLDPTINPKEKEIILKSIGGEADMTIRKPVPWRQILRSAPFWALVLVNFGQAWGYYTIVVDLPKFLNEILHFSMTMNGFVNALPWLVMFFVIQSLAFISDWIITENYVNKTFLRKSFATLASVGGALFMVSATHTVGSRVITVFLLVMAVAMLGCSYVSVRVNALDLAPNFAGLVYASVNCIGAFAGIFSTLLIGHLTADGQITEWRICFWIIGYIMVITLIPYLLFGSAEVQPWNEVETPTHRTASS